MIYLAGDSVFDNASYTSPSLIQQMGTGARLVARDGACLSRLADQLRPLMPAADDSLVISIGGNDALPFARHVTGGLSAALVFETLEQEVAAFERAYASFLRSEAMAWDQVVICTIYNGRFAAHRNAIAAGVRLFDDAIQRVARRAEVGLIDLRDIFTEDADYANDIEPSHVGAAKLVAAIRRAVSR